MKKILITSAIALASVAAQAQTYGEIGLTSASFKASDAGISVKSSLSAVRGFVGYEVNPNVAIEGMIFVLDIGGGKVKVNGETVPGAKLKIDSVFGIYVKPKMKASDKLEIFGRIGYANSKATISIPGVPSESDREGSASYGAGLSYAIDSKTSLNADYMQYLSKDGLKVNGFTFGVGYKF